LSFKTKSAKGVFGVMVIYGWPILKSPIGKSIIIIFPALEKLIMNPNLNFPVKFNLFGFKARMVGALNHESNGKVILSRSWNRIILHAGFERKNWTVYLRPWFRMPAAIDDNPDISEYRKGRRECNLC
jgi:hypothetical protein